LEIVGNYQENLSFIVQNDLVHFRKEALLPGSATDYK